jgi:hypothetical protein
MFVRGQLQHQLAPDTARPWPALAREALDFARGG